MVTSVRLAGLLDPELNEAIAAYSLPPPSVDSIQVIRSAPFVMGELSDRVQRTERLVPGDPPVPVRIHRPAGVDRDLPAILTIHGGGLVFGSSQMDDVLLDRWCPAFGILGVSVDYRLAPETPYPGPLEDCYTALRWLFEHAGELGADPQRIGIFGISAGGGLAAALALLARDRGEVPVRFQVLDCPMLDDRQTFPSIGLEDLFVWTREWNEFGWRSYLGPLYGTDRVPPYAAASRAADLAGLPPAFISVGSIDGFRDENVDFATRLNQAGVPCELHVYAGLPHGHSLARDAQAVRLAAYNMDNWVGRQLAGLTREEA